MCIVQTISVDYTSTENNVEILHWCFNHQKVNTDNNDGRCKNCKILLSLVLQ